MLLGGAMDPPEAALIVLQGKLATGETMFLLINTLCSDDLLKHDAV